MRRLLVGHDVHAPESLARKLLSLDMKERLDRAKVTSAYRRAIKRMQSWGYYFGAGDEGEYNPGGANYG